MRMNKLGFLLLTNFFLLLSCGNDDDGDDGGAPLEERDIAEVAIEDDAEIQEFLRTHFYNQEDFMNPPADFDFVVVIDTIAGENADRTPLTNQVNSRVIVIEGSNGEDVPHTLYTLEAREGIGIQPTVADSTFLSFEGNLLDGSIFDSALTPVSFNLGAINVNTGDPALIRGFFEGISEFRAGDGVTENGDGTFTINGFGSGLIIMPSGLGFFDVPQLGIPQFAPLIFNIQLVSAIRADHDGDGILSIEEDLDGDGFIFNDDTDNNGLPNYLDSDDDGDGTLTINEFDEDGDGEPDDSDGDGIPDYLDND